MGRSRFDSTSFAWNAPIADSRPVRRDEVLWMPAASLPFTRTAHRSDGGPRRSNSRAADDAGSEHARHGSSEPAHDAKLESRRGVSPALGT